MPKTPRVEGSALEPETLEKRPKGWHVRMSTKAERTTNPIRAVIEKITSQKREPIPGKPVIPLSLGDPTAFGNLAAPHVLNAAIVRLISEKTHNGYGASAGLEPARAAIAERYSSKSCKYAADDIVIASGCSGALEIAITGMLNEGDNLLMPRPGFPLYQVLAESIGAEVKFYDLLPEQNWEADTAQLDALVDERTRAVVINNPSNPCGSVYSKRHLLALIAIAQRHKLPIIADEIYGEMTFGDAEFFPSNTTARARKKRGARPSPPPPAQGSTLLAPSLRLVCSPQVWPPPVCAVAELSEAVPVISVGGLAKQFVVPGWRVGWLMMYGRRAHTQGSHISSRAISRAPSRARLLAHTFASLISDAGLTHLASSRTPSPQVRPRRRHGRAARGL